MWSIKREQFYNNICSRMIVGIILVLSLILLTACGAKNRKEKPTTQELNDQDILTLEFYLSDQAELQTDGTMEFQL